MPRVLTLVRRYGRLRVAVRNADGNRYVATDENPGPMLRVVPS